MIHYLLGFKNKTDVAVRTLILTLLFALLVAVASEQAYSFLLPVIYDEIEGTPYFVAFSLVLMLSVPIVGIFFAAGLEINNLNTKLTQLSRQDPLTGLLNRRSFIEAVAVLRSQETKDLIMRNRGALLIVDADHFKRINDVHGHQAGDEALVFIADILAKSVRGDDVVSRLGGEEFGIFLHEADERTAYEVAERIRTSISAQPVNIAAKQLQLSVSIGGTQAARSQGFSDCMRNADTLLYAAKHAGRNKTIFAGPAQIEPFKQSGSADYRVRINARA